MRSYRIALFSFIMGIGLLPSAFAQEAEAEFPSVEISDMNGKNINTTAITHPDSSLLILTWKSDVKNSLLCLDAISAMKDKIAQSTRTKVIMINFDSTQDVRNAQSTLKEHQWGFVNYLDPNEEFKKAAAIDYLPVVLVVNPQNKIAYRKAAFYLGDEQLVLEALKKISPR
ncbi:AhpC/TSA family protein [Dyadobacter soli]|uniref:AhpC/TSA family protein n=1 Tax=Dyadobacter soli TaxID=659014 RepID=A0A1G7GB69_9BACT|nr:thioredoxin-like domain-containing protein [Dyadobacter soli]SDE85361.1 AhpC/TSA family protein [Dyadobacter soli]